VGSTYYCVKQPGECDGSCEICPVSPTKWKARCAQEDDSHLYNENPEYDGQLNMFDTAMSEDYESPPKTSEKGDNVVKPPHYTKWPIEPINFIMRNNCPFWLGNVIKYCMRAESKNGVEDLRKAQRYIEFRIRQLEGEVDLTK